MRHQHLASFFAEHSNFLTSLTFFSIKIALAAPTIMYLVTYKTFFNALSYAHSVKGYKKDSEITDTIGSKFLKLSSSHTDHFRLAKFI